MAGMRAWLLLVLVLASACLSAVQGFLAGGAMTRHSSIASSHQHQRHTRRSALRMGPIQVEFTVSNKSITAEGGTLLSQVCAKAGVAVKYNCKQGTCATCTINVDGRNVRACNTKLDPFTRRVVKIRK